MTRYMVSFELPDVDPGRVDLDVAYAAAQQVAKSGLAAWGYRDDVPITVSCPVEPISRAAVRWSVTVKGHPVVHPQRSLVIAFDAGERRGAVVIMDDEPADPTQHSIYLRPRAVASVVRSLMSWPLDMLEDMAREDEQKRRGGS